MILSLVLLGCAPPPAESSLVVWVTTDLVLGKEVFAARTELFEHVPSEADSSASTRVDRVTLANDAQLRVASYDGLAQDSLFVRTRLLASNGTPVLERIALVELVGATITTLVMTRDCRDVMCPDMDPAHLACLGGRCVDPRCTPETPEHCPEPTCTSAGDCAPPRASCASADCEHGECLLRGRPGVCDGADWCDPDDGCQPGASPEDAGTVVLDAGSIAVDAGASSADAGVPVVDAGPAGIDAGLPALDAGPAGLDAGPAGLDAGSPALDAGPAGLDAGAPALDAGPLSGAPPCPGVPSCTSTLTCNPSCGTCNGGRCQLSCTPGNDCTGSCNNVGSCGIDARGASDATFACNNASSCLVWGPASNLTVSANNASNALVECRGSSNCTVDCQDGHCLVDCAGTAPGNCRRIDGDCTWSSTPCPGTTDVFVCGRSCP